MSKRDNDLEYLELRAIELERRRREDLEAFLELR